jgi:hypothetical protein
VSQDFYIHLRREDFPAEAWREVLAAVGAAGRRENEWVVDTGDGCVWLDVRQPSPSSSSAKFGNWQFAIRVSGRGARKERAVFAIALHAMILLPGATFYDPQADLHIAHIDSFVDYANERLIMSIGLPRLAKLGMLDSNERVILVP